MLSNCSNWGETIGFGGCLGQVWGFKCSLSYHCLQGCRYALIPGYLPCLGTALGFTAASPEGITNEQLVRNKKVNVDPQKCLGPESLELCSLVEWEGIILIQFPGIPCSAGCWNVRLLLFAGTSANVGTGTETFPADINKHPLIYASNH